MFVDSGMLGYHEGRYTRFPAKQSQIPLEIIGGVQKLE